MEALANIQTSRHRHPGSMYYHRLKLHWADNILCTFAQPRLPSWGKSSISTPSRQCRRHDVPTIRQVLTGTRHPSHPVPSRYMKTTRKKVNGLFTVLYITPDGKKKKKKNQT